MHVSRLFFVNYDWFSLWAFVKLNEFRFESEEPQMFSLSLQLEQFLLEKSLFHLIIFVYNQGKLLWGLIDVFTKT